MSPLHGIGEKRLPARPICRKVLCPSIKPKEPHRAFGRFSRPLDGTHD